MPLLLLAALCALFLPVARAESVPAPRPNILFIVADDWGRGHAGAYGCGWVKTPNFDRVAREGLLFLNAYTPTAKCTPSRSAILTGRNPWQLGAAANHQCAFPPEYAIFPDVLTQHGYAYATTGKVWGPGTASHADGTVRNMAGKQYNQKKAKPPASGMSPNDYAANFAAFLADTPAGQPWFFWLGCLEPHRDYEYGSGVRVGGKKTFDIDRVPAYWPDNETVRNDMLDYALEVEHFDAHVGRVLALLEQKGMLDNTLVVVTSDNGMPFPRVKGSTYENANHLPLAIRWPNGIKNPGRTVNDYVSFVDFAPTFLEAASVAWPAKDLAPTAGRSLTDIFRSGRPGQSSPERDHVLIGRERNDLGRPGDVGYPIRGIAKGGLVYLENCEPSRWPACNPETGYLDTDASPTKSLILDLRREKGTDPFWDLCFGLRPGRELYDVAADPDCVRNLAEKRPAELTALRDQMWAELKAGGDLRAVGRGAEYEAYPSGDVKKRGFYERTMRGELIDAPWVKKSDYEKAPLK